MRLTLEQLDEIIPKLADDRAADILPHLNAAMAEFGIDSSLRVAAFVAQIAHETGGFQWFRELWGPTPQQEKYEPPNKLAQRLGNTQKGDGKLFRGRGAIQLTGRDNYKRYGELLNLPLLTNPKLAEQLDAAFRVAACFWQVNGLNALADANRFQDITKRINGGLNGLADRLQYYEKARIVLGIHG